MLTILELYNNQKVRMQDRVFDVGVYDGMILEYSVIKILIFLIDELIISLRF